MNINKMKQKPLVKNMPTPNQMRTPPKYFDKNPRPNIIRAKPSITRTNL